MLNTVSTGAHVLLGKIHQNRMLDLCIRNSELLWRTLAMCRQDMMGLGGAWLQCLGCHRKAFSRGMEMCGDKSRLLSLASSPLSTRLILPFKGYMCTHWVCVCEIISIGQDSFRYKYVIEIQFILV